MKAVHSERGIFQRMVCCFPENPNPNPALTCPVTAELQAEETPLPLTLSEIFTKTAKNKEHKVLGRAFQLVWLCSPRSWYLGAAHWLLSQLACFVCSDCKRKKGKAHLLRSLPVQGNNLQFLLTSQEIF